MSPPFRVALIGYGTAGEHFHAPLIASTPGLELTDVVTANPARQERVRARHPDAEVLTHAEALWWRPDLDLVVVATPNAFHVPLARAAVGQGLAVVVDKPLAVEAADAARLLAEVHEARGRLTVFQNRRWDDDFLTLRQLVEGGTLGEVHRLESRFERWRPTPADGWRESGDPEDGGGVLLDLGAHLVDQARLLLGPVVQVQAEVDVRRPGARADDDAFVALEHASGARSHLWASAVAADLGPRFRVLGSAGAFVVDGLDQQEAALRAGRSPDGPGWGTDHAARRARRVVGAEQEPVTLLPGDYPAFYREVVGWLLGHRAAPVDPQDAVTTLEILAAARRSAAQGAPVAVAS